MGDLVHSASGSVPVERAVRLTDLFDRLSATREGSRHLDGAVWFAIHEPDVEHGTIQAGMSDQGLFEALECERGVRPADNVLKYTASVDAALSLLNEVLPGWGWQIELDNCTGTYFAFVGPRFYLDGPSVDLRGISYNPAAAVCIAVIRGVEAIR